MLKPLRAGELNRRVEIQANTPTTNDIGELVASWATVATIWAKIEPVSGRELLQTQQVQATATARIRMRYRSITPLHRIKHGDDIYEINAVIDVDDIHEQLELLCTAAQ